VGEASERAGRTTWPAPRRPVGAVASDLGGQLTVLRADGGLTRSRLLMQAQADLLQLPVEVCRTPDATALGVAALARIGLGQAAGLEQAVGPGEVEAVIEPRIGADEAAERMAGFARALQATLAAGR
jgi:glycerol kinase